MFLLELGELLEEWTRKKSMEDLARCMALNVDRVWLKTPESEILTAVSDIRPGDKIVIRTGSMIPMDGILAEGEVTVNQASLTGESVPVVKHPGNTVYAGTVIEEGSPEPKWNNKLKFPRLIFIRFCLETGKHGFKQDESLLIGYS